MIVLEVIDVTFFETGDVELKEKFNDKFVKETVAFLNTKDI